LGGALLCSLADFNAIFAHLLRGGGPGGDDVLERE
jgi:hypothetical protein